MSGNIVYHDRAFQGDGVSVYATTGLSVTYRKTRVGTGLIIRNGSTGLTEAKATERIAKSTTSPTVVSLPSSLIPSSGTTALVSVDMRRYKDEVENTSENVGIQTFEIDNSGDVVSSIDGTGVFLGYEVKESGTVVIKFRYEAADSGINPLSFSAIRTAGPSSPSDVSVDYSAGTRVYRVQIDSLLDSSAYTYKIQAVNGAVTRDIITGKSIQADATGPTAPTSVSAEAW